MVLEEKHYLDTSAFLRLWPPLNPSGGQAGIEFSERELLRIRRRLLSPMFLRRPVIVIGIPLLTEIAAAHENEDHRVASRLSDQVEFLKKCRPLAPLGFLDCIRAEIEADSPWVHTRVLDSVLDAVDRERDTMLNMRQQFH